VGERLATVSVVTFLSGCIETESSLTSPSTASGRFFHRLIGEARSHGEVSIR